MPFSLRVPNSGSFVRPSPSIALGRSFLHALLSKYVEIPLETPIEKVMLGSSKGAIEVEAVGMNKVRNKLARVERLREVSLDMENVAYADTPGEVRQTCPSAYGSRLECSVYSTGEGFRCQGLRSFTEPDTQLGGPFSYHRGTFLAGNPQLEVSLCLSCARRDNDYWFLTSFNRLELPPQQTLGRAFAHLRDLRLNGTLTTWEEVSKRNRSRVLCSCTLRPPDAIDIAVFP
jgi:hypothetical protein